MRDAHAVPHVEAEDERDAYLAMGFLHGQDRLWQMEFHRLVGQGRLAELLGEAALPFDRFLRTLGLAPGAEAALAQARARRRWPCSRPMPTASTARSPRTAGRCRPSSSCCGIGPSRGVRPTACCSRS